MCLNNAVLSTDNVFYESTASEKANKQLKQPQEISTEEEASSTFALVQGNQSTVNVTA